jgi:hypothetical protein
VVAVAPGVSGAAEPQAVAVLGRYFTGINAHSYPEYASALDPQERALQPQSKFDSGFATTKDSAMTLTSLVPGNNGGQVATVTFTSRQSPADSIDSSACNAWTLNFYLVAQTGGGYLVGPAPASYQPSHSDC